MQNGYVVILAVGMLLCVLTGNVDLGVGSVVATFGGAVSAFLTVVVNFIITAFVLFCIVRGINKLMTIGKQTDLLHAVQTRKAFGFIHHDAAWRENVFRIGNVDFRVECDDVRLRIDSQQILP